MKRATYNICEYGVIRSKEDYSDTVTPSLEALYLPAPDFDSLYSYISANQDASSEIERPFTLLSKGRRRQIKVRNYVGVIETKDGLHLEILPKIHHGKSSDTVGETKRVFFKMLKHLKNSPFVNVSKAHLEAPKDFPILEVFIKSYLLEVENKLQQGIKHDYIRHEENASFLKGKLNITENVKHNHTDRAHFYCEFSEVLTEYCIESNN